jgi:nucleoside-diphosphate-sugar epimerase
MPHKKIAAVTGATGFVGGHLITALAKAGYHVRALTRRPQEQQDNITWISGDLKNTEALEELTKDVDVIYHLAGVVKAKNYEGFAQVNIDAVPRIVKIAINNAPKAHFILLSSLTAREPQLSDYAMTKYLGENALTDNIAHMPWTILRPPGIYGPNDYEILKLFKGIKARIGAIPGSKENRISIIYIKDLADALVLTAHEKNAFSKTLDIDDGHKNGYSVSQFVSLAAEILDIRIVKVTIPKFLLKFFGYLNYLFSHIFGYVPMVTHKKVNELCFPDWICKDDHAMNFTKWEPKVKLKTGLEKTLKWYKEKKLL